MKRFSILTLIFVIAALVAYAGPHTRTIFDAFNPSSTSFVYCDTSDPQGLTCTTGSATDDGWFRVIGVDAQEIIIRPDTVSLTSGNIECTIEARTSHEGSWITSTLVAPIQFTAAQAGLSTSIYESSWEYLRVGIRINGVDDAVDDSVTVHFNGGQ